MLPIHAEVKKITPITEGWTRVDLQIPDTTLDAYTPRRISLKVPAEQARDHREGQLLELLATEADPPAVAGFIG